MTNKKIQFFSFSIFFWWYSITKNKHSHKKTQNNENSQKAGILTKMLPFMTICVVYTSKNSENEKNWNYLFIINYYYGLKPHFRCSFRQPINSIPLTYAFSFGPNRNFPKIQGNPWKSMKINENQWKSTKINENQQKCHFFSLNRNFSWNKKIYMKPKMFLGFFR